MSKQEMRHETERLIKEALERKTVKVTLGDTKIEPVCGKCGAKNKLALPPGQSRASFKCKECGHQQMSL
jgi:hypothetical protein